MANPYQQTVSEIIYGYWNEHPDAPVCDWQYEVANGDTREGYWQWAENKEGE